MNTMRFAQQAREDVETAFAPAGLFDDNGNQRTGFGIGRELPLRAEGFAGCAEQVDHECVLSEARQEA